MRMLPRPAAKWVWMFLPVTLMASAAGAQEAASSKRPESKQQWLRVTRPDADADPDTMDTAIVRYEPEGKGGLTVDLIAAVHIGDRSYYEALNKQFEEYDVLLYELVAPPGHSVPRGSRSSNAHPVGAMQNAMKGMLGLEHQLELVDYTKKNFVHADMTPEQFKKSMSDRNESFLQIFFRAMGHAMAQQGKQQAEGKGSDLKMLWALFDKDRDRLLKQVMADQFEDMESAMVGVSGPEGSTLITERNKVAIDVLRQQIAGQKKKIGIFYGAGHMSDMDTRLREQFQLRPTGTKWLTAWDMRAKPAEKKGK